MRAISVLLLFLCASPSLAGFTVSGWCPEVPRASLENVEAHCGTFQHLLDAQPLPTRPSNAHALANLDFVQSCEVILSAPVSRPESFLSLATENLVDLFVQTSEAISTIRPADTRVELSIDVNGVSMGGLATITGVPIGNGRQGIVRLDGLDGTLLQHSFANVPSVDASRLPYYDDPVANMAEETIFLLFVGMAFISSLRHQHTAIRSQPVQSPAAPLRSWTASS